MTDHRNYARGALLGLACGDSLGTTLEFSHPPEAPWSPLLNGPHTEVIGGGPFHVLPGQVTDDSMMASALAASLKANDGFDLDDVAQRYCDWRNVTFDCGSQTGGSIEALNHGIPPDESGKQHWERGGSRAAGNGSLMRTGPIGVFFHKDRDDIVQVSLYDSGITHFDPRCMLACAGMNAAIGLCVRTAGLTISAENVNDEALKGIQEGAVHMTRDYPDLFSVINSARVELTTDLAQAKTSNPLLYGENALDMLGQQGFVRVAFRLAFWELHHASTFRCGLLDAVNRGGDADTNGAIVGELLGAFWGSDNIPMDWAGAVLNCDPPGPLNKAGNFHPERMMELADVT